MSVESNLTYHTQIPSRNAFLAYTGSQNSRDFPPGGVKIATLLKTLVFSLIPQAFVFLFERVGMWQQTIDILPHFVIIPLSGQNLALQYPCSEGRHGKEKLNPTFLLGEEWGFYFGAMEGM